MEFSTPGIMEFKVRCHEKNMRTASKVSIHYEIPVLFASYTLKDTLQSK